MYYREVLYMKEWFGENKGKILFGLVISVVLAGAYFGGSVPKSDIPKVAENSVQSSTKISSEIVESSVESIISVSSETERSLVESVTSVLSEIEESSAESTIPVLSETEESLVKSESSVLSETEESSVESISSVSLSAEESLVENTESSVQEVISQVESDNICEITISCAVLLNHLNELSEEKKSLVPSDGYILKTIKTEFSEGESVFDVLKRVCSENKIHMEFSTIPLSGGAYIEGINNLYEMDCGYVSGWMFSINGEFASRSCSDYELKKGDQILWQYTCDLGKDIGNDYYGDDFYE